MKYRIKQQGNEYYVQYKFLFLWLYVTHKFYGATVRDCYNSLYKAGEAMAEKRRADYGKKDIIIYHYHY